MNCHNVCIAISRSGSAAVKAADAMSASRGIAPGKISWSHTSCAVSHTCPTPYYSDSDTDLHCATLLYATCKASTPSVIL